MACHFLLFFISLANAFDDRWSEQEWVATNSHTILQIESGLDSKDIDGKSCRNLWAQFESLTIMNHPFALKTKRLLTDCLFKNVKTASSNDKLNDLLWANDRDLQPKAKQNIEKRLNEHAVLKIDKFLETRHHREAQALIFQLAKNNKKPFDFSWESKQRHKIRSVTPLHKTKLKKAKCSKQLTGYYLCANAPNTACKGQCGHRSECPCCYYTPSALKLACKGH